MDYRIGIGYDIHRLIEDRKLFLGGVEIAYNKGLLGYSDGDVLLHAICDALLGALGLGDIGEHFPDNSPDYKDIASIELLKKVNSLVEESQYKINNVDSVIIAQEPRISPFKKQMRQTIAKTLGIDEESISIKAKTNDKLGQIGANEAMAAYAVVIISRRQI
ncbi:MAG: 2-C-methyl-D-erythritol 2,4-cyclodiphosphate synthase [Candidatus Omnitrophica bacterium]|nr:2-C-methyl-D-erythritol 2,4-cyclodiphosphate synthase [Candidatus Omnitrophota bacterium]